MTDNEQRIADLFIGALKASHAVNGEHDCTPVDCMQKVLCGDRVIQSVQKKRSPLGSSAYQHLLKNVKADATISMVF